MRWLGSMIVVVALGCPADDGEDTTSMGSAADGGTGATTEGPGQTGSFPGDGGGSGGGTSAGTGSSIDPCDPLPNEGDACATDEQCIYGDDCGSWTYGCVDGTWTQVDGTGCGAEPIPCEAMPVDGDPCGAPGEVCDPDGDCLQVLECGGYIWDAFDVCTEVACADAQPIEPGGACELPSNQFCSGAAPCEGISYRCLEGAWAPFGGGIPDECQ